MSDKPKAKPPGVTDDTEAARGREDARVMENIPEFDEARFWVSHDATGWAVCYRKDGRKLSAMPILHDEQVARTLCNAINEIVDEERAAARAEGAREGEQRGREALEETYDTLKESWSALAFDYDTMPEPLRREAIRVVRKALDEELIRLGQARWPEWCAPDTESARAEGARAERDVLMNLASFVGNGPNEWTSVVDMDARIRDGIDRLLKPVVAMRDEWKKRYEGLDVVFQSTKAGSEALKDEVARLRREVQVQHAFWDGEGEEDVPLRRALNDVLAAHDNLLPEVHVPEALGEAIERARAAIRARAGETAPRESCATCDKAGGCDTGYVDCSYTYRPQMGDHRDDGGE